jgi:Whi5 like
MPTSSGSAPSPTLQTLPPFDDHSSQSSFASQHSAAAALKLSTSDVSRITLPAPVPEDLTPPSSTASPQKEHGYRQGKDIPESSLNAHPSSATQSTRVSRSPSTSGSLSEGTSGTKRTASGQVKKSIHGQGHPADDASAPGTRHVRASSTLSTASTSNVAEVRGVPRNNHLVLTPSQISQQLRTRLKYAMVKVQNGWQTRSLDELESIASASPRSHASPFIPQGQNQGNHFSPRETPVSKMNRKWSDSTSSEESRSESRLAVMASSGLMGVGSSRLDGNPVRGLAPPADIVPGSRRRPTPNEGGLHPPPIRMYQARPGSQRTLSQNAAMEAEAVETLLFMSSPNNSGYHPPSHASQESSLRSTVQFTSQTSPLRSQFSQTSMTSPKRVAFSDQPRPTLPLSRSELIDNMIDNVADESDGELDAALSLADQRQQARLAA